MSLVVPAARSLHGVLGAVLPAVLLAVGDFGVAANVLKDHPDPGWRVGLSFVVASGVAAAVAVRRRWPGAALAAALGLALAGSVFGVQWDPFVGAGLVSYSIALAWPRQLAAYALACAVVTVALGAVAGELLRPGTAWWLGLGAPLTAACWYAGRLVAEQRRQAAELDRRREHQIVVDERLHIARELHDVLTHGMGLIAVKAGIAKHLAGRRPEEVDDALRVIEKTSREALTETRQLLDALREDSGPDPRPGLEGLPELVDHASGAGVTVELDVGATTGELDEVPRTVQLAAYRIAQEAVTNTMKHAAPARCRMRVWTEGNVVRVEVADDGAPRPEGAGRPGHGLVGMRERAAMHGGTFSAGPLPEGGFGVSASLPYQPAGERTAIDDNRLLDADRP